MIGLPLNSPKSEITRGITKTRENISTKKGSLPQERLLTPHIFDRTHREQNRNWLQAPGACPAFVRLIEKFTRVRATSTIPHKSKAFRYFSVATKFARLHRSSTDFANFHPSPPGISAKNFFFCLLTTFSKLLTAASATTLSNRLSAASTPTLLNKQRQRNTK